MAPLCVGNTAVTASPAGLWVPVGRAVGAAHTTMSVLPSLVRIMARWEGRV